MLKHLTKRVFPLILTFTVSALLATTLQSFLNTPPPMPTIEPNYKLYGSQSGACRGKSLLEPKVEPKARISGPNAPYLITSIPKALYTDAARANSIQGSVRLKITLLGNGSVGNITPVTELPNGLTEQAVAAARQIKFQPKKVNGRPVSVVITREYTFTIY